ncbi:DUF4259 domain-containing protein [Micromonospora sp. CMU55-4]|nr:DUF4259 domain-containing protein [Micromonospora sp. CMU55-4]
MVDRRPHRRTRQPSVPGLRSSNPELLPCKALGLDDDLPQLAIEALDRVLGDDSEWRSLWGEAGASEFPPIKRSLSFRIYLRRGPRLSPAPTNEPMLHPKPDTLRHISSTSRPRKVTTA